MRPPESYPCRPAIRVSRAGAAPALLVLLGCGGGPAATLHLIQPSLPGWQQHLHLTAEEAWWSPGEHVDRLLVGFPPPGAATGRSLVLLYLRCPAGLAQLTVAASTGPTAKGFFIQTRGEYAGLSGVVGGTITLQGRATSPGALRKADIRLNCEDGTLLVGRITARRNDGALREFETRQRPVDVALLIRQGGSAGATRPTK